MRIEQMVPAETKRKLGYNNDSRRKKKKRHKRNEQLTRQDIEELMGIHRDTYKRVNGKIKRK